MKRLILFITVLTLGCRCLAQHSDESSNLRQLALYQDSLTDLGEHFINDTDELARINSNYQFIKIMVRALKVPNSFLFPFDSLKTISIINSPDNRFRVFSWHVLNQDGSYRFYGAVQMNTGGNLRLFPLADYSPLLKNPEDSVTDNRKWYGAQYYKIIKVSDPEPYYVMLGWKGNTDKSTKKVIEVLAFKNDKPQFGMSVFDGKGLHAHKRIIFEYTRQASMLLKYIPEEHLIVFDHLSPPDAKSKNMPETYGPDLSYDGFRLRDGRWQLVENLDMRNVPEEKDNDYIDPKKTSD
jgi:hypothetical protein